MPSFLLVFSNHLDREDVVVVQPVPPHRVQEVLHLGAVLGPALGPGFFENPKLIKCNMREIVLIILLWVPGVYPPVDVLQVLREDVLRAGDDVERLRAVLAVADLDVLMRDNKKKII